MGPWHTCVNDPTPGAGFECTCGAGFVKLGGNLTEAVADIQNMTDLVDIADIYADYKSEATDPKYGLVGDLPEKVLARILAPNATCFRK